MAVYRYKATKTEGEQITDFGTIVAQDIDEAKAKLIRLGYNKVRLKRLTGLSAIWKGFRADIK